MTSASKSNYEFHSFHINIGTGDGSIHLLVQVSSDSKVIEKAILIDGGENKSEALPHIKHSIERIEKTYTLPEGDSCLKFDRILVTHWDTDHYVGLVALLRDGFQKAFDAATDTSDLNKIQIAFLRYNADGTPKTILHGPYWFDTCKISTPGPRTIKIKSGKTEPKAGTETSKDGTTGKTTENTTIFDEKTQNGTTWTITTIIRQYPVQCAFLQAEPAIDRKTTPFGTTPTDPKTFLKLDPDPGDHYRTRTEWPRVLVLVSGTANILGINFLNGQRASITTDKIETVDTLLSKNVPATGQPGMYCVAVNALVLGRGLAEDEMPPEQKVGRYHRGTMDILDDSKDINSLAAQKNAASISCMVLWAGERLSHYFAGDARWEVEQKICSWSGNRPASCMKLSHHGATNSTPLAMLDTFTPANLVVSAGGRHNHPSWPTILLVDAWMRSPTKTTIPWPPRACVTNFATYLRRESDGTFPRKNAPMDAFTKVKPDEKGNPTPHDTPFGEYVGKLRAYFALMVPPVKDPWTEFWELNAPKEYQWAWLAACVERAWLGLCEPKRGTSVGLGAHTGPAGASGMPDTEVCFFFVRSLNGDGDGRISIAIEHQHELVPLVARPVVPVTASKTVTAAGSSIAKVGPSSSAGVVAGVASVDPAEPVTKRPKTSPNSGPVGNEGLVDLGALEEDGDDDGEGDENENEDDGKEGEDEGDGDDANSTTSSTTASTAASSTSSNYYYIYSSDLAAENASSNSTSTSSSSSTSSSDDAHSTTLGVGSSLDNLVGSLHRGLIVLESKPTSTDTDPVDVVAGDELAAWFSASIGGILAASAPSSSSSSDPIGAFTLTVAGLPHGDSDGTASLIFHSTTACLAPAFGTDTAALAPAPGIVDAATLLILGIDSTASTQLSTPLSRLLDYAGVPLPPTLSDLASTTATLDWATSASDTARANAVWFLPWLHYTTNLRLQFTATGGCDELNKVVSSVLKGFNASSLTAILRTTATWLPGPVSSSSSSDSNGDSDSDAVAAGAALTGGSVTLVAACKITVKQDATSSTDINFQAVLKLASTGSIQLTLLPTDTGDILSGVLTWLSGLTGIQLSAVTNFFTSNKLTSSPIQLRRLRVTLVPDPSNPANKLQLSSFAVDLQVTLNFGTADDEQAVVFLVSFHHGSTSSITGGLWCGPPAYAAPAHRKLLPEWEDHDDFQPSGTPTTAMDLKRLFPNHTLDWVPPEIPTVITRANITVSDDGLTFGGQIVCDNDLGNGPSLQLGSISLDASYQWAGTFTLAFGLDVMLTTGPDNQDNSSPSTARLQGDLRYDSDAKSWSVSATISDLTGAALYSLFDKKSRDSVVQLLSHIQIPWAELYYDYTPTGSQFSMMGTLLLGPLELDLNFEHDSSQAWTFIATLQEAAAQSNDNQSQATVGSIIESVFGDTSELPDFVANIKLEAPTITLSLEKAAADGFILAISCSVGGVSLMYAQYRGQNWSAAVASKRVIKVAVHTLPSITIPLVGDLSQPFNQLDYLWVQDKTGTNGDGQPAGLTSAEVGLLNALLTSSDSLVYKDTKKGGSKPADVVITTGSHLVLVLKDLHAQPYVLLDYAFKAPAASSSNALVKKFVVGVIVPEISRDAVGTIDTTSDADTTSNEASMAPLQTSSGALHISNIGFKYEKGVLSILLDAFVAVGPISLALLGFSLGVDLKHYNLWELPDPKDIVVSMHGLGVAFSRPPIELAGLFLHYKDQSSDYYAGGAIIAARMYLFAAAGFYGIINHTTNDQNNNNNNSDSFISVFVFAKLDGPLVELEFGEISGITAGFGYNSGLLNPSPDQVPSFPFIASQDLRGKPAEVLAALTDPRGAGWFFPKEHSYWLAAGLTVDTFQILSISAVAVVQWDDMLKLSIFAVGLADIPGNAVSAATGGAATIASFAHVELGILATIDLAAGVLQVEAELSPNSYVLARDCHPTGGFALYYWFLPGTTHYGDWVFSIGGYHQAFQAPSWYPHPKRVGMTWSLTDKFCIQGSSYFAITPSVCMAGGQLYGVLTLPVITGFFDARADFLVNYAPFHFEADMSITVGIRHTTDQAVTSSDTIAELSAQLQLYGPPIGGRAQVEFMFWHLHFDFGPDKFAPTPVMLTDFYNLVLELKGARAVAQGSTTTPDNQAHRFTCQAGLITDQQQDASDDAATAVWAVRAAPFSFLLCCSIVIQSATTGSAVTDWSTPVYAKPLQLAGQAKLESSMTVSLTALDDSTKTDLMDLMRVDRYTGMVPKALWGEYTADADPAVSGNNIGSVLDGSNPASVELMTGLVISAPDPTPSDDPNFDVEHAPVEQIDADDALPAPPTPEQSAWLPADSSNDSQWENARTTWQEPRWTPLVQPVALNLWLSAFEHVWATSESQSKLGAFEGECGFGRMPSRLYDSFDQLYVEPPRIAVGGLGGSWFV